MIYEALGVLTAVFIVIAVFRKKVLAGVALIFGLIVAILLEPVWLIELFIDTFKKEGSEAWSEFDNFLAFIVVALGGLIPSVVFGLLGGKSKK